MKTCVDCIPCFIRQALDAVRMVTNDESIHEQLLCDVLYQVSYMDFHQPPPAMGQYIHRAIRELTGESDPYRKAKDRFNRWALDKYDMFKANVGMSSYPLVPLLTAARLAIAGNIIDFGTNGDLKTTDVVEALEEAMETPIEGDLRAFAAAILEANNILYLADNAGEIVFDRLLIEEILELRENARITVAVRGAPVINDATLEDARVTGLTDLVEVIDNGSDAPGTLLSDCSELFRGRFESADVILAKGQGNYETLSEADKNIFFLLKAKCPIVARDIGCEIGTLVLMSKRKNGSIRCHAGGSINKI